MRLDFLAVRLLFYCVCATAVLPAVHVMACLVCLAGCFPRICHEDNHSLTAAVIQGQSYFVCHIPRLWAPHRPLRLWAFYHETLRECLLAVSITKTPFGTSAHTVISHALHRNRS